MNENSRKLERLEEAHAFSERTTEQLSEDLRDAFERIVRLEARLARLDDRLEQLRETVEEDERTSEDDLPPHSVRRADD